MDLTVGIDFDNTIVCHDAVFFGTALEKGLISPDTAANKAAVKEAVLQRGGEPAWRALQGQVYGVSMQAAELFPGVLDFFCEAAARGVRIVIVSHKTHTPLAGPACDLHAAVFEWLGHRGFFAERTGLIRERVFCELTRAEKLKRIAAEQCGVFIDDLPGCLLEPEFPAGVRRILFDPHRVQRDDLGVERAGSWDELRGMVLGEK